VRDKDLRCAPMTMLSPYRVLDLTTERGLLCGQMLGDLGADVIKVEPPGGSPARMIPPFFGDQPHPDRSLYWWAYNRNKRSITADLEHPQGREIVLSLIKRADFLIESFNPGYLESLGLGYPELAALNPALIYVSITPFGQDGPKANYADSDLIVMAAGGPLVLTGDDDRPPVRLSVPQGYLHASADAAVGALMAHHERVRSGSGQHVDIAAQISAAMATQSAILAAPLNATELRRMAGGVKLGPVEVRLVWPAKDGYVTLSFLFGSALGVFTRKLMEYMCERGFCDGATRDIDWIGYGALLFNGRVPIAEYDRIKEMIAAFTSAHTKAELLALAMERGFLMTPVTTVAEVVQSAQLESRGYWQSLEHSELGRSFLYPGPFAKFGATPIAYRRRPPMAGEHNGEILGGELGLSDDRLAQLAREGII
jgi:crotonobetainyl-CoA:carnitine CoA-transferase CaiB-like acyl-CoA transferase